MLQKFIFILCCALSTQANTLFAVAPQGSVQQQGGIQWFTNYEQAVQKSKAESKPLVLFFTGSDWCTWCQKLEEEALNTPEFASAAKDRFVFVKLDFPLYSSQDSQLKSQNKQLQSKFNIRSFPTIVIVDQRQGQQIGTTGYRPGGGKQYADFILRLVADYNSYQKQMGVLDTEQLPGNELIKLHDQAKKLNLPNDINRIVKIGMDSEESLYFLVERYRFYADEGLIHNGEAKAIRQRLLAKDPNNAKLIPYQVAIIEFETACEEADRENYSAELTIAPLIAYMEKYGESDKENIWRLQMLVSQVYLDKNQITVALKYAQDSYESAPMTAKPGIAATVENIRSHCVLTHAIPQS